MEEYLRARGITSKLDITVYPSGYLRTIVEMLAVLGLFGIIWAAFTLMAGVLEVSTDLP